MEMADPSQYLAARRSTSVICPKGVAMGVMLTLDGPRLARGRRRGQHTRSAEEQACVDAFAAFLHDPPGAGRTLSRLGAAVLADRLLPAARALADAVDLVLADQPAGPRPAGPARPCAGAVVAVNFTVSPACLLGLCRDGAGGCDSPECEHDCHSAGQTGHCARR
jgi:hypothetical protein